MFRRATTIRLYREWYGFTGPTPLGNPHQVKGLEQAYEYRAARAAYDRTRFVAGQRETPSITRTSPSIDRGRGIGL